ncbi:unnamed protein product [marine sediment metagenome]|uniref:Uncharacterized protein n=1 Tax=marine sediment metagenome TaxID=412755 RepID=X1HAF5_9ZZZZ
MKEGVIYDLNKIDMIEGLKLDFFRVDYFLTRKESKPYLCQICKLNEICQNDFDYECIEASDFLFKPRKMRCITCGENEAINDSYKECEGCIIKHAKKSIVYTVKDDFLDSLIKKNNKALRG